MTIIDEKYHEEILQLGSIATKLQEIADEPDYPNRGALTNQLMTETEQLLEDLQEDNDNLMVNTNAAVMMGIARDYLNGTGALHPNILNHFADMFRTFFADVLIGKEENPIIIWTFTGYDKNGVELTTRSNAGERPTPLDLELFIRSVDGMVRMKEEAYRDFSGGLGLRTETIIKTYPITTQSFTAHQKEETK